MAAHITPEKKMIFTGRYQDKNLTNEQHLLVRISRGSPRWKLKYEIDITIPELAPPKELKRLEWLDFSVAYYEHLDYVGESTVKGIFRTLRGHAEGRKVVLLCFCDYSQGHWCHRLTLTDWARTRGFREKLKELSQPEFVIPAEG